MAGGAVAREVLKLYSGVEVLAYVQAVQDVRMPEDFDRDSVTLEDVRDMHQRALSRSVL